MKNSKLASKKHQKGVGLVELSIWFAIVSSVILGVFTVLKIVQSRKATNNEIQNATIIAADLRTKFADQNSFTGISVANAIKLNVVPKSIISGASLVTSWGTSLNITPANVNGNANDGFALTYEVPADNCSDFVSGAQAAFSKVTIGSTVVKDLRVGDSSIDVADLANCNAAVGSNDIVEIVMAQGR